MKNVSPIKPAGRMATCALPAIMVVSMSAHTHEAGAPFSGAIIDPITLHHAHIENEQRLNWFALRKVGGFNGPKRDAFESELELGWSNDKFNFGAEAFVPYRNIPSADGQSREVGIGDMEIRPIKYAFINRPDLVMSTASGVSLPTGNRNRGLGSGNTTVSQFLFVDKALGNLYAGLNLSLDKRIRGEGGAGMGYGAVIAYSFINGVSLDGFADPKPSQSMVVSASLEFVGSKRFGGTDAGEKSTSISPGITFWLPKSGWQLRAGVNIPGSGTREADRIFLLQLGNHLNWDDLFTRSY